MCVLSGKCAKSVDEVVRLQMLNKAHFIRESNMFLCQI